VISHGLAIEPADHFTGSHRPGGGRDLAEVAAVTSSITVVSNTLAGNGAPIVIDGKGSGVMRLTIAT
jgi:hypothetical protein